MNDIIELRSGSARARVAPGLGARVTHCELQNAQGAATALLHPYPEAHTDLAHWAKGGLYPMIPYWGRISHARLRHAGEDFALVAHPDALPHTLHGTAHQAPWTVVSCESASVALKLHQPADAHWPWPYEAEMVFVLAPQSLHIALAVTNTGTRPMPAGIGLHPYIARTPGLGLKFTAPTQWMPTADHLATGARATTGPDDFSSGRRLGDTAFTMFYSDWAGEAHLTHIDARDSTVRISASATLDHLVLHQPAGAPYVCLEPASHTSDAFNLAARGVPGTGTRVLAAGERLSGWATFSLD